MLSRVAPIGSLLLGVALMLLGNGLFNTLLTVRGSEEGYSTTMLGVIMSGYFVGFLVGTRLATPLISRVGHIRAFASCAALAVICILVHVLIIDPWVWLGLRVFYGLAIIGLFTVIESWLNTEAASEERGQVFAIYMTVNLGALALGQQLLQLADPQLFILFALAAILLSAAMLPITLTRKLQPTLTETPPTNMRALMRVAPLALVASAISGMALGAFWGMMPVYATLQAMSPSEIAWLMSCAILGGAVLQWPIGLLSDRFDRRYVLFWIVALTTVMSVVMSVLPAGIWLYVAIFIWGGMAFAIYSVAVAQLIDQLQPEEILSGSSSVLMVYGIGSIAGPLLGGMLMDQFGAPALPMYFAATLGALAIYTWLRLRRVSDLVTGDAGHFVPMVNTSPTVLEMMPDAPETDLEERELEVPADDIPDLPEQAEPPAQAEPSPDDGFEEPTESPSSPDDEGSSREK